MSGLFHNPALEECKTPIGAVKTGERVFLSLPGSASFAAGAFIFLFGEEGDRCFDMQKSGDSFVFELEAPQTEQVMWYYFKVRLFDGQELYIGESGEQSHRPSAFQLTVYRRDFETPRFLHGAVMYQIFPDRFAQGKAEQTEKGLLHHAQMGRSFEKRNWDEEVKYEPAAGEKYYSPNDIFGGSLNAIEEKLPYLKSLGVTVVYLNPIFEAASNHRYDTADYSKIDPILGTNEDFVSLCRKAEELGIKIMPDGVFSHTGSDSVYFNRKGNYQSLGAYQGVHSPYFTWYEFEQFPDKYKSWWGFETLPEVHEWDENWQSFMFWREDAVIPSWIKRGACGYRLDVADEIPDGVLEKLRVAVKNTDKNAAVLGEVWEDATTKEGFGVRRKYALGGSLDTVMNYPFRTAVLDFFLEKTDAFALCEFLKGQRLNYPQPMYYSLMNLLSSHDVPRARTVLGSGLTGEGLTRVQQSKFMLTKEQDKQGAVKQRLCAFLQYSLPGMPALYYGDEQGMQGFRDPFNRAPMKEGENPLVDIYKALGKLRDENDAMKTGFVSFYAETPDILRVLRYIGGESDAFSERAQNGCFVTVINRSKEKKRVICDLYRDGCGFDSETMRAFRAEGFKNARCVMGKNKASIFDGMLDVTLEPQSGYIFELF